MKEIILSSLFKKMECRMSYDLLAVTKNGTLYEIGKGKSSNQRLSECLLIKDDVSENLAIIEFLRNYLRSGSLKSKTKKNILAFIKEIKDSDKLEIKFNRSNYNLEDTVQTEMECIISEKNEIRELYYNDLDKFRYNTSAHDMKIMVNLVLESRIKKISPYKLVEKYKIPSGTIFTWYKNINEIRIVYTFYTMDNDYIQEVLSNYDKREVLSFQKELISEINNTTTISSNIKKVYIDLINDNINRSNQLNDMHRLMKIRMIEKILQESSQYSKEFIISKKQEILDLIIKDKNILDIIIENIELEI